MARPAPAHFDPAWYLDSYPDVARAGIDPVRHYLRYGQAEGRLPCCLVAAGRERDLRFGLLPEGLEAFAALRDGPDPAERAWASLASARYAARTGDWPAAADWLAPLDAETDLIAGFARPDDALLAIEVAVMTGAFAQARQLLALAWRRYGAVPDLILARANILAAQEGPDAAWRRSLRRLFWPRGLRGLALERDGGTAFDRLGRAELRPRRSGSGPLISVIMPARNAGATIDTALHSLCAQSWTALEVLVVDNGSTDDTVQKVQGWAGRDPRIRLLDGSAEPGAYPARNIGLAAATGAYVTVLDADDWAHPARLALQVRALIGHPARQASVSHWVRTTPDLRFTRWWGDQGLVHRNVSSLMIRAGLRDTLGYWDRARAAADSEYYERILAVHGAGSIHEVRPGLPLSLGRSSDSSLTRSGATHISSHYYGARRSYYLAARRWHGTGGGLPLPQHPAARPFVIPQALALDDPAPARLSVEERLLASPLYDDLWYMQSYPDLRARDEDGVAHYLSTGAAEGRDPGPEFSTSGYGLQQRELGHDLGADHPLVHALDTGSGPCLPDLPGDLPPPAPGAHLLFVGHQARATLFGAERSLLDMLDRAIAVGMTPSVLLPHLMSPDYHAALTQRCHRIHLRPFGWLYGGTSPHPGSVETLTRLIRDIRADALHQNTCVLDAPLLAARAAGIPGTVHVREIPDQDPRLCFDLGITAPELRDRMVALADHLVANGQGVLRWLDRPEGTVPVRPNSIEADLFDLPFTPPPAPAPIRVALIGSLIAKKGIEDMRALAQRARDLPAEFVLIGASSPELEALAPLPDNLTHLGYAETPRAAMAEADIVVSLSKVAESFGRTVLEAMAAGRPVITYDRGTPPELVGADGAAGRVVPADDVAALHAALGEMLADRAGLSALSVRARARARALNDADLRALDAQIYAVTPPVIRR